MRSEDVATGRRLFFTSSRRQKTRGFFFRADGLIMTDGLTRIQRKLSSSSVAFLGTRALARSRFSGRASRRKRAGDAREHGVEVLARLRVRGEVAEDHLEQVVLRESRGAGIARSGSAGQRAKDAGGRSSPSSPSEKNVGEARLHVRARQDARRGDAPAGHPRSFPWSHPRAGGCSCGARPLPRGRAPRVSRTPPRPRHERAPRSSPRPPSRFLPPSLFLIPRPTRAPPRRAPRRRARPRARPRGTPFPPFP